MTFDFRQIRAIRFYSNSYEGKELSNFYPCKVKLKMYGTEYAFKNAEAAYQAHKTTKGNQHLFSTLSGKEAKEIVKTFPHVDGWGELTKDAAMKRVLQAKFTQNPELQEYLVSTYPKKLIHWAPWDTYWGWSEKNNGWNILGVLLMELRDELR